MTDIRDEIISEVRRYMVGPREEEEEIPGVPNYPVDYYTTGILFPRGADTDARDHEDFEGAEDRETVDHRDLTHHKIKHGSIGLRVDIADGISNVDVEVGYAKYSNTGSSWKRIPLRENNRHVIDLGRRTDKIEFLGADGTSDACLTWILDEGEGSNGRYRVLSLFLENSRMWRNYERGEGDFSQVREENNVNSMFQPFIKVHSDGGTFRRYRSGAGDQLQAAEDQSLDLAFRDTPVFGEGLNCAAIWDGDLSWVRTEFVPEYLASAIGKESKGDDGKPEGVDLHPLSYADGDDDSLYKSQFETVLRGVINGYMGWISGEQGKMESLVAGGSPHAAAARNNIEQCKKACKRMEEGLEFLLADGNKDVRIAFALANRTMLYQREHYKYCSEVAHNKDPIPMPDPTRPDPANPTHWYPFQIAFFLMNIRGMADRRSDERDIVDLLWFPTGGGKTEAYMAVAAFTMIYRRLRGNDGGLGTSVIMRYTLRLLTLQQFERASTMMCALEFIRQNNGRYSLGDSPFLLGLWVGNKLTPNRYKESKEIIEQRVKRDTWLASSSPMQLIRCPWCGTELDPWCYHANPRNQWTTVHCSNKSCFFSSHDKADTKHALPVLTVDSDIYRRCPSMIIATVDKFARMPYRPEIASIFGRVDRYCERHGFLAAADNCGASGSHRDAKITRVEGLDGPDLIIQDELHLITGALGSMVGLYETAVDYLSRRKDGDGWTRPKIIGSTATIRGADTQIRRLFDRDPPHKFPPPGIDRNDSFFWWESKEPGRKYVGVSFSHRSSKYALAKIYASLLHKVDILSKSRGHDKADPYWTLVGYFNSIRELGGAIRLVEDDVRSNIRFMSGNIPGCKTENERDPGRPGNGMEELTGRITQSGIRSIREKLEKNMDDPKCISTLLATNMISVGVDIERLGMMVVNGQTKNASEYIQATGRIGRRPEIPGLVFTMYNPYKPRDLSHYENFTGHHSMLQRNVEPSTLTPFSIGSMERGMHAVLIAMIRLSIPRMSSREAADNFEREDADDAMSFILERYASVQQVGQDDSGYKHAKKYIRSFVDNWTKSIQQADSKNEEVWYHNTYKKTEFANVDQNDNVLMADFSKYKEDPERVTKPTPESLRDVERSIRLEYR